MNIPCRRKHFDKSEILQAVSAKHFERILDRFLPTFFQRAGLHFVEIPVNHRPRKGGISKYSIGGRAWRGIYDLVGVGWLMKRRVIPTEVITT